MSDDVQPSIGSVFRVVNSAYGPYAFGVAMLLLIWYLIIGPTLRESRIDTVAMNQISDSLSRTAAAIEASARLLEKTANRMETITDRIYGTSRP